jgi:branched-chain amino acid transport system substrate-binding protein
MGRLLGFAALTVVVAGMVWPISSHAADKPPVLIGNIATMSGPYSSFGQMEKVVVDIAIEDINASGGINGSKVTEQTEDGQLNPAQAILVYRKLAAAGAIATIGPVTGTQWQTVAPIAQQVKLPAATINAVAPGITVRPWTIRFQPPDDTSLPSSVDLFLKKFPSIKKVVIAIDSGEASTIAAAQLFQAAAKAHGIEVVGDVVGFTGKTMDLSPVAIQIKNMNADALWTAALQPQQLLLAKALAAQDYDKPRLANGIFWSSNFVSTVGDAGKDWYLGGFSTNTEVIGDNELYKSVSKRILDRVAKTPGTPVNIGNVTIAYDTMMIYADILRKAGIDGNTPVEEAREKMKDGFMALKHYRGLNVYDIRDTGDADVTQRLMTVDVATGQWKFAD